jgi:L-cysteine:1D-myo-inositol 2-amino-2-deoxy-alpha-D-glucopyranoside ligase
MNSWAQVYIPPMESSIDFPNLKLYNSATKSIEALPSKDFYQMYVCGITPYDATHLGHAATYITFDLINRYLRAGGARVDFVQNITDIDDPLFERAKRDNVDWSELATSQIELFRGDMVDLHIIPPKDYIGVVEAIPMIIESITTIANAASTYSVDSDLYFDVHSDKDFGKRSHLTEEEMLEVFSQRGGDPLRVGKRDPLDALLWLHQREGEPGWDSPFGKGRPGWHIECSAIAMHYLDDKVDAHYSIDIQGGGSDLIFPHHEMSASQSKVISKKEFARSYVHTGMIGLDGEKMSKSKGNLLFVSKMVNKGINPMAIRLALISQPYALDRMWTQSSLDDAIDLLEKLNIALSREEVAPTKPVIMEIIRALSNNLDTPAALLALSEWSDQSLQGSVGGEAGELSRAIDSLLGIAI